MADQLGGDVHGLVAAEHEVLAVHGLLGELEGGEPLGERLEHLLALEAGQRGAEAVVDAVAEGEVVVVGPGDVEPVGVGERARDRGWPPPAG